MTTTKPNPKRYVSDKDVADRFGVTRQTVWNWHRIDPTFPRGLRLSDRCTRWDLDAVEAWATARAHRPSVAA